MGCTGRVTDQSRPLSQTSSARCSRRHGRLAPLFTFTPRPLRSVITLGPRSGNKRARANDFRYARRHSVAAVTLNIRRAITLCLLET
ncbi:unnamed protein product [Ixodes pacificus]